MTDTSVLVVGAGPTGLVAAHCLAAWGVDVTVLERRTEAPVHPQATMVNARTLEILRFLGLAEQVLEHSATLETASRVTFLDSLAGAERGRIEIVPSTEKLMALAAQSPVLPVICPQRRLQQTLAATLPPSVRLWTGCEVTGLAAGKTDVTAEYASKGPWGDAGGSADGPHGRIRARYVILADGRHDTLGADVGIETRIDPPLGTLLDIHFTADLRELTRDRESVLYWILDDAVRGVLITVDPMAGDWLLEIPLREGAAASADHLGLLRRGIGTDVEVTVHGVRTWAMGSTRARAWSSGRVFVAGDAAHTFPPTGGFGMNTGVQDAHALAWRMAGVLGGWGHASLLEGYGAERGPVAAFNATQSEANARAMWDLLATGNPSDIEIERHRPHFDFTGQALGFRYGADPVVADVVDYTPVVAPGARAPHFWLEDAEGHRVSTLDLSATSFALFTGTDRAAAWADAAARVEIGVPLAHHPVAARHAPGADLRDRTGRMRPAYRISGAGAVLVRPDGHTYATLPGDDPCTELITAITNSTGFAVQEVHQ